MRAVSLQGVGRAGIATDLVRLQPAEAHPRRRQGGWPARAKTGIEMAIRGSLEVLFADGE